MLFLLARSVLGCRLRPSHVPDRLLARSLATTGSHAEEEVVIALGSNVGDRIATFHNALHLMRAAGIRIFSHANLYETAPAYVTHQPTFLNSAVKAKTSLDPHALLHALKRIESQLGRLPGGVRYGPRPIDLDIIFYGHHSLSSHDLTIPHPRIWERPFVLAPLMDLHGAKLQHHCPIWSARFHTAMRAWELMGGQAQFNDGTLKRVLPLGKNLWDWSPRTSVMGILNVTPDSFSDGGKFLSVPDAVARATAMIREGVDIIDIGAQSTRPGATRLTTDEELQRLLPVVEAIVNLTTDNDSVYLSVDTFDAKVAREAVKNGVHMVNDVSGGTLDPEMHTTVAELGVPYVMMHMRGDPTNMQSERNTSYQNVCQEVADELCIQIEKAESLGVPAWRILTDPGLGFSKTQEQTSQLVRNLQSFRAGLASWSFAVSHSPLLIGPSRKSFIGNLTGEKNPQDRDVASLAAAENCIAKGADVIRMHHIKASSDVISNERHRWHRALSRAFWSK